MDKLIKIQTYLIVAEMLSVTIVASAIMVRIWYDYRFRFLLLLCFIMILTDVGDAFLAVGLGLENTEYH
jgi:hypothetical protein